MISFILHHKHHLQLLEQPSVLVDLGRDQFGNFVMQKLVEVCALICNSVYSTSTTQLSSPARQRKLIDFYLPYLPTLRRAVFGKHIATCIEKLHHRREQEEAMQGGAEALAEAVQGLALAPADEGPTT